MDALAREVAEETGMTLEGQPELFMAQDIFVDAKGLHVVRLTYRGSASGDIVLSDEHQSYKWVGEDELLNDSIDPYLKEALRA